MSQMMRIVGIIVEASSSSSTVTVKAINVVQTLKPEGRLWMTSAAELKKRLNLDPTKRTEKCYLLQLEVKKPDQKNFYYEIHNLYVLDWYNWVGTTSTDVSIFARLGKKRRNWRWSCFFSYSHSRVLIKAVFSAPVFSPFSWKNLQLGDEAPLLVQALCPLRTIFHLKPTKRSCYSHTSLWTQQSVKTRRFYGYLLLA